MKRENEKSLLIFAFGHLEIIILESSWEESLGFLETLVLVGSFGVESILPS